jgi:hypothetical protein
MKDEMNGACSMHGVNDKCIQNFGCKALSENLKDLGIDEWMGLKKYMVGGFGLD